MLLAALAPVASAAAADRVLVANVPRGSREAQRTGAAPATERLRVGFVLAHPHPDAEDALLRGLFDRSSPNYHRFLTPAQYAQRFGVPRPRSTTSALGWPAAACASSTSRAPATTSWPRAPSRRSRRC